MNFDDYVRQGREASRYIWNLVRHIELAVVPQPQIAVISGNVELAEDVQPRRGSECSGSSEFTMRGHGSGRRQVHFGYWACCCLRWIDQRAHRTIDQNNR